MYLTMFYHYFREANLFFLTIEYPLYQILNLDYYTVQFQNNIER